MDETNKDETIEEDEEEDEDDHFVFEGSYDPGEFEELNTTSDIKDLFKYITCYTPQIIDLDVKLKPFIPDYIPAVGDIDAFIKIPRPDGVDDQLGLVVLDEPSSRNQSDATLLNLQLRAVSKDVNLSTKTESVIKIATSNKDIDSWIQNIKQLHETTSSSSTSVTLIHTQRLPDVEQLMQEWPEEFENALNNYDIPSADLDCPLEEYLAIICGMFEQKL